MILQSVQLHDGVEQSMQLHGGVESKIHGIFRDSLELDVDVDTDVIAGGLLDSLAFVQLLVSLEEEFGLEVNLAEMDLEDFSTVSSIARLVGASGNAANGNGTG